MNKTKRRLLSYLLLAIGGLNLGGVSNAQPKDANTSNISSENSERNLKISNILTVRNGIDFVGLLAIICGGKKLKDKNKSLEELNDEKSFIETLYNEKVDNINLFRNFQHLFYLCFKGGMYFSEYNWKDLTTEDCKNYGTVRFNNSKLKDDDHYCYQSCYFISMKRLDRESDRFLYINRPELSSVLALAPHSQYDGECGNLEPFEMAGYSVWYHLQNNLHVKIIKFGELLKKVEYDDLGSLWSKEKFDECKEKFKNYYILCEVYTNRYEKPEFKDEVFYKFSLVKLKEGQ